MEMVQHVVSDAREHDEGEDQHRVPQQSLVFPVNSVLPFQLVPQLGDAFQIGNHDQETKDVHKPQSIVGRRTC